MDYRRHPTSILFKQLFHLILLLKIYLYIFLKNAIKDDESSGILKYIGEQLKNNPDQRCVTTDKCLDKVREGSSIYIFVS